MNCRHPTDYGGWIYIFKVLNEQTWQLDEGRKMGDGALTNLHRLQHLMLRRLLIFLYELIRLAFSSVFSLWPDDFETRSLPVINSLWLRIRNNVSPMKIQKRPFYDFKMKFMMYLDYSIWKFPIPSVGEGGKRRGKLSHWLYKPKFLPFIPSRLRGRGGRASDFQSVGRRFDPWWRAKFFFSLFFSFIW